MHGLEHQSSDLIDDFLKLIEIIIEASNDLSSWSDIEELIDWCFHDSVQSFLVNKLQ